MLNMFSHISLMEIFASIYNVVSMRFFKVNITWFGLMFHDRYNDLYSNLHFKIIPIVVSSFGMHGNMNCVLFTLGSVRWLFVPPLSVLQGDYAEAQLLLVKERTQV
jgi:hypothetical protein